ncbi:uncharacterized protein LOC127806849 [Diospyros lotus]|uniref:uncharacterized protein LOC127806849 n=1 Tax=Diospyros lotus TaxID=55363 RepID=UPI002255B87A|nr:uncharacterized protein LOC127806849 [Diospyros lotus]XP_052200349.1 uncharacterized protein LOC127806849 [Diospyros lotus]
MDDEKFDSDSRSPDSSSPTSPPEAEDFVQSPPSDSSPFSDEKNPFVQSPPSDSSPVSDEKSPFVQSPPSDSSPFSDENPLEQSPPSDSSPVSDEKSPLEECLLSDCYQNSDEFPLVQWPLSYSSPNGDKSALGSPSSPSTVSSSASPHSVSSSTSSCSSSASRVSSTLRSWKLNKKRWSEFSVIQEEGEGEEEEEDYNDDIYTKEELTTRHGQCLIWLFGFILLFAALCLIILGASRPYRPQAAVKTFTVNNFYFGQGLDYTGVPTKLLTVNCSMKMVIYNPSTYFGIHVRFTPVDLFYSEIKIATGQLKTYYQPRKSRRIVSVSLEGSRVPLYGAGPNLAVSDRSGRVPLKLEFGVQYQRNLVGTLVKTKNQRHISCKLVTDSRLSKAIDVKDNSCAYL